MFNIWIILFVASEMSFYLLIAQTGIVESFGSNIFLIAPLPIGGLIGSIASVYIKSNYKISALLILQLLMSLFYPNLNLVMLFILGFAVGGIAPLIIETLKKATKIDFILALGSSYLVGTLLFSSIPQERGVLAIVLTLIALVSNRFIDSKLIPQNGIKYPIYLMMLWVFLDSALFETLSRDFTISIWRGGYTFEIALFHILGVIFAIKIRDFHSEILIAILFTLSYLFYFIKEPLLLSIVYPFVISYYNITILKSLVLESSLKKLGLYMFLIGWLSSGMGLFVSLFGLIKYVPILFLFLILRNILGELKLTKEVYYG